MHARLLPILSIGALFLSAAMIDPAFAAPAPPAEPAPTPAAVQQLPEPKSPTVAFEFDSKTFRIKVDRAPQQLLINSPKPEAWLQDWIGGNSSAEVSAASALVRVDNRTLTTLPKGSKLYITSVEGNWAGTTIMVSGEAQSGWVQTKDLKPLPSEPRAYRHIHNAGGNFVSAAMLIQKAKQFDDGLYAAVELAAQNGLGKLPSKSRLIQEWAATVNPSAGGQGLDVLLAAGQLGGSAGPIPAGRSKSVADIVAEFKRTPERSKPLAFYTWSSELTKIFQQDRMLQSPMKGASAVEPLAQSLRGDKNLSDAYLAHLDLAARMTNPPLGGTSSDLRPLLTGNPVAGIAEWQILPPSTSHETQLFLRLFGNALTVPDDFDLMQTLVAEIRAGKTDLKPRPDSGWYDHQTWALQPLLLPEKMPEAGHLLAGEEYRKLLENLFKGTLALTRETHVKQLALPAPASAAFPGDQPEPKTPLAIAPNLSLEPLPTMYLRRAQSYAFIRQVLTDALGAEALQQIQRQTQDGPVKKSLDEELREVEALFYGAQVVASRQLGMAEEAGAGSGEGADKDAVAFLRWSQNLATDADLGRDCRMMVPVFTDPLKKRIKVWCVVGWAPEEAWVSYMKNPALSGADADGKPIDLAQHFEVSYHSQFLSLARPVFAEVWVTQLLDRAEFRRHCDTYVTPAVILANLK